MSKVIISGAGGFVGSELTKKLVENGIEVVAISQSFGEEFPDSGFVRKFESTIDSATTLLDMIPPGEYMAFYHLAWKGVNGQDKANPCIQVDNVKLTMMCADAAKQLGVKKFLCSGTVAEWAVESLPQLNTTNGGMTYGIAKYCTHLMLEMYCKNIGLDFIWMQFSNIYGPQNKTGNLVSYTLNELMAGREALFGPALQPYDFIFIDDLLEAVYRLAICETSKNQYVIGSGNPQILRDYLTEIGRACDKSELIKIGMRQDDGIVYKMDMFDNTALVADIGNYVTKTFCEGIRYTVANYGG